MSATTTASHGCPDGEKSCDANGTLEAKANDETDIEANDESLDPNLICYCLVSHDSRRTYVGATKHMARRIRQHNGIIKGGAKYTRRGRPWTIAFQVSGFRSWREVLQFEWRFKHIRRKRRRGKYESPLARRHRHLRILLTHHPWCDRIMCVREPQLN